MSQTAQDPGIMPFVINFLKYSEVWQLSQACTVLHVQGCMQIMASCYAEAPMLVSNSRSRVNLQVQVMLKS